MVQPFRQMTEQEVVATVEETKEETKEEVKEEAKPARKNSRAEKKMKDALLKHGIKPLENVMTVVMRKASQIVWTFSQPDVYCLENVYVVFGEPSMDPTGNAMNAITPEKVEEGEEKKEETVVVDDAVEADASGLKEDDINVCMQQANVSRARAIEALKAADGDIVTAVMNLMN